MEEKQINGKTFRKVMVGARLHALTGEHYALLSPYPIAPDSWQLLGQQRWVCVKTDPDSDLVAYWKEDGFAVIGYPPAFHFVTYCASIEYCEAHSIWIQVTEETKKTIMLPYYEEDEVWPDESVDIPEPVLEGDYDLEPVYNFDDEDYYNTLREKANQAWSEYEKLCNYTQPEEDIYAARKKAEKEQAIFDEYRSNIGDY